MKKLLLAIVLIFATPTLTLSATDALPRSITATTQGQACKNILDLASIGRSLIVRTHTTPSTYVVTAGRDWELNASDAERLALLMALACLATGNVDARLDMMIQDTGGKPLGEFRGEQLITYPRTEIGAVSTIASITKGAACWNLLGMANRAQKNDLIVRSFTNSVLGYVVVVGDAWKKNLTNEQKLATILTLACGATGGTSGRLDMQMQDLDGNAVGRLVNGQMELY